MSSGVVRERPASADEAAALLRELGAAGRPVAVRGGGTKAGWGVEAPVAVEVETGGLDRVLEHNEGDFTAVLEAGVRITDAQAQFARAGQMLALDPPLSPGPGEPAATVGGLVASADSGPLRQRYGGVRDLVVGITVVLSDGTVANAGGRVIKNVAGYDLGKLFAGSHGTLGLIARVAVRLHPRPDTWATARACSDRPGALAAAAGRLAASPIEAECLDVGWQAGSGWVLVRFGGPSAADRAQTIAQRLTELGLDGAEVLPEDDAVWEAQRAAQRCPEGVVVKVAGVIGDLEALLEVAQRTGARVTSRAGLGLSWLAWPTAEEAPDRVAQLRERLPEAWVTVLDGAHTLPAPWPPPDPGALAVMERIKARFDPARVFSPGHFVGGL